MKLRELNHEQADVLPERLAGLEECGREQVGVQKILVWLPSARPKSWQVREFLNGDLIGHFEREKEIGRHLRGQTFEVSLIRKSVVGGIDANRFEDLRVFGQTQFLKA